MPFFHKVSLGLLLLAPLMTKAQNGQTEKDVQDYPLNLGISITQSGFNDLVTREINTMKDNKPIQIKDLINMVRIYNTITFNDLINGKNRLYKKYCDLFDLDRKYDKLFISRLHATISVGMGYYSKKYNIQLGGTPHENSKFKFRPTDILTSTQSSQ